MHFNLPDDVRDWQFDWAQKDVRDSGPSRRHIFPILYRPFDRRFIYYTGQSRGFIGWPVVDIMGHMLAGENVGFITTRQTRDEWGVLATSSIIEGKTCAAFNINSLFPLYLYPGVGRADRALFSRWSKGKDGRTPNLDSEFVEQIADAIGMRFVSDGRCDLEKTFGPEDVLAYIYAVFYSPGYRSRYKDALRLDFPRVPRPGSSDLFRELAQAGHDLLTLHLFKSSKVASPSPAFVGSRRPEVGRVGWSDDTVWLDAGKTDARASHRATKPGTTGFKGVPEEVWDFYIGGYQVLHKWLKYRKGRTLSKQDIAHYQKIVVALNETIRVMARIDERIEAHGGWPEAFHTGSKAKAASKEKGKVIPFRPRRIKPALEERYVSCVPLIPLKAAAGAFSDPQHIEDDNFEWAAVESRRRLRKGMFVAQVVGKSMEPAIPDGAWCLFRSQVAGTRQGKTVLVQLRDGVDPETGQRYTVKRYRSEKAKKGGSWRHRKITLEPVNPDFEPIVLTGAGDGKLQVLAELVEVLGS